MLSQTIFGDDCMQPNNLSVNMDLYVEFVLSTSFKWLGAISLHFLKHEDCAGTPASPRSPCSGLLVPWCFVLPPHSKEVLGLTPAGTLLSCSPQARWPSGGLYHRPFSVEFACSPRAQLDFFLKEPQYKNMQNRTDCVSTWAPLIGLPAALCSTWRKDSRDDKMQKTHFYGEHSCKHVCVPSVTAPCTRVTTERWIHVCSSTWQQALTSGH